MEKYKTVHENKVLINPPQEDLDSGLIFPKQPTLIEIINNLTEYILKLDKYNCQSNSGGEDCWSTMEIDESGEYVKLEDVLNLFRRKKQ